MLVPDDDDATRAPAWRELTVVLGFALGAGLAVKAGLTWSDGEMGLARNLGLLVFPFLAAYFGWKRRLTVPDCSTPCSWCWLSWPSRSTP